MMNTAPQRLFRFENAVFDAAEVVHVGIKKVRETHVQFFDSDRSTQRVDLYGLYVTLKNGVILEIIEPCQNHSRASFALENFMKAWVGSDLRCLGTVSNGEGVFTLAGKVEELRCAVANGHSISRHVADMAAWIKSTGEALPEGDAKTIHAPWQTATHTTHTP